MATTAITINIDTTLLPTAIAALNWRNGYQATLPNGTANPVAPGAAAKQALIDHIFNIILEYNNLQALQSVSVPASNLIS